ncbi:FliH/SctL family protein [Chitinimonas sp.]|uniref:FliH/SctL family protein n=1 Tax=Chitinimonas sp. TaxID=1934313 RepID=UPI0035AF56C8
MTKILRNPTLHEAKRRLPNRRDVAAVAVSGVAEPAADAAASEPVAPQPVSTTPDLVQLATKAALAKLKGEAEQMQELARQRGLKEGRAAGAEEARQAMAAELARLRSIAEAMQSLPERGFANSEDMALAIAFEAVCMVLGEQAGQQEAVAGAVKQAARQLREAGRLLIRLHPQDLALLRDGRLLDTLLAADKLPQWVEDETLALGGCIIETEQGDLDASFDTQLSRLRERLLRVRAARH